VWANENGQGESLLKEKASPGGDTSFHGHVGELPVNLHKGGKLIVELETETGEFVSGEFELKTQ